MIRGSGPAPRSQGTGGCHSVLRGVRQHYHSPGLPGFSWPWTKNSQFCPLYPGCKLSRRWQINCFCEKFSHILTCRKAWHGVGKPRKIKQFGNGFIHLIGVRILWTLRLELVLMTTHKIFAEQWQTTTLGADITNVQTLSMHAIICLFYLLDFIQLSVIVCRHTKIVGPLFLRLCICS